MREIVPIPAVLLLTLIVRGPCASKSVPALGKVTVAPFVVAPQPLEGAPDRPDQDAVVRRLTEEATARAELSLLHQRVAAVVECLRPRVVVGTPGIRTAGDAAHEERPSSGDGVSAPILVTGTVYLPVSLPPPLSGVVAWFHHGPFAKAEVQVRRAHGEILAREAVTLDWRDIRWFTGAGRLRHSRPLDDILVDFVRKATDRAIKRLKTNEALWLTPRTPC